MARSSQAQFCLGAVVLAVSLFVLERNMGSKPALRSRFCSHFYRSYLDCLRFNASGSSYTSDITSSGVHGEVTKIKSSVLDRNVAIITFNLWLALLVLTNIDSRHRFILAVMGFMLTAAAIFISEHDSSQVALLLSPLIFFSALFWPRLTVQGLATTWCLAFVLVLPAVLAAYKAELHEASWLPSSARHRVIIWE